jgi:purine catabolism regulator
MRARKLDCVPGMTVQGLLDFTRLGLTVHGGREGLDAPVRWAHVSELEDPLPFLEGGELILTGGVPISSRSAQQVEYLRRLQAGGVAGLIVSQGPNAPRLTRRAIEEADRLRFPLLELPVETPYIDVVKLVAAANEQETHQRLMKHLQIFETLQAYQAAAVPLREFIRMLSDVSGFDLYAASPAGKSILPGVPVPPDGLDVPPEAAANGSSAVPGGYCLPVIVTGRVAARLVALRRDTDQPAGFAAAQHLTTVLGVALRDLYQRREAVRREGAEVLSDLLNGGSGADAASKLVERGFEPMKDVVFAVIRSRGDEGFDNAEIHHRLCDRQLPSLLITRDDLLAVVPDTDEARAAIDDIDSDVAVGVSAPFSPGANLTVPWRQARWSLERAVARRERVVRYAPTDTAGEWLPLDRGLLAGVVDDIVGPVVRYDEAHGSELIGSLRVLFRHDRRMKAASEELGVHHHTLAYRMRTVERLSGRSLKDLQGLVDLWLSMKALDVLLEEQQT